MEGSAVIHVVYVCQLVQHDEALQMFGQQDAVEREVHRVFLPSQQFTLDEYRQLRLRLGKEGDGRSTLRVWISRKRLVWDEAAEMYVKR